MMMHSCTCDEFAAELADFLEHDVDERTRAAMESHARSCAACGALLADVRELTVAASALPELAPQRDLWSGIAARIEAPVVPIETGGIAAERRRDWLGGRPARWALAGAAAAALVVISAGTTYLAMRGRSDVRPPQVATVTEPSTTPVPAVVVSPTPPEQRSSAAPAPSASPADSIGRVRAGSGPAAHFASNEVRKPTAEQTYGREIATLRAIVERRRSTLDTATVAVIEKNLAVIDSAIAQCRAALARDPASGFLLQSLNSALESKVELLRTAAMLPAHT